jgi:hypothetical protein
MVEPRLSISWCVEIEHHARRSSVTYLELIGVVEPSSSGVDHDDVAKISVGRFIAYPPA